PECERAGLAFVPYFPLASGLLTGKYTPGQPPPPGTRLAGMAPERLAAMEPRLSVVAALTAFAEDHGHTVLEVAMSWLLRRPVVASVIAGATTADQVRRNAAAADWVLDDAQLAEIDKLAPADA
ncbi:MAG TPA: aldo/keto reductase, partial [Acidimicrobiales bacterium]|nr:aldo/keto reductase [Acidimicrobiales bacterium]